MGGRSAVPAWSAGQILFFEGPRRATPARILYGARGPLKIRISEKK